LNKKFMSYSDRVKYGLMGVNNVRLSVKAKKHLSPTRFYDMYIPEAFDAREKWDMCPSLKAIRDQSSCAVCSDDASNSRNFSEQKVLFHCDFATNNVIRSESCCGNDPFSFYESFSCYGGDPMAAWKYWVKEGIVTGSNFTIKEGCKPYPFPPCEHHSNKTHYEPCKHDLYPTPKCERKCVDGYSERTYEEDKFYGNHVFHFLA
uniref:Pept_C1 domain-containing protein n=1 Tax=Toxocara canis TaxID=6265 RepID=A0A183VGG9_TOXCA